MVTDTKTKAPAEAPPKPANVPAVVAFIDSKRAEIAAMLPQTVPSEKFMRVMKNTLMNNPEALECSPRSVFLAVSKCAQDGLVMDGREAALVTFKTRVKKNGKWEDELNAQYIPMRLGVLKRMRNSGEVSKITQNLVYLAEFKRGMFIYEEGSDAHLKHTPWFYNEETGAAVTAKERGPAILGYSVAKMRDGTIDICVMPWADIMKIKARTRSKKKVTKKDKDGTDTTTYEITGPWLTDEEEMAKKTVLRRHAKSLPMDSDVARILERDNDYYSTDEEEGMTDNGDAPQASAKPTKKRGGAAAAMNAPKSVNPQPAKAQPAKEKEEITDIDPETGEIIDRERPDDEDGEGDQDQGGEQEDSI